MQEIFDLAKAPAFWFSSVVVAFFMSLLSSYARDWIEGGKVKFSNKRAIKKALDDKMFQEELEQLKGDAVLMSIYQSDIVFQKTRNILYYIVFYLLTFFAFDNVANYSFAAAIPFGGIALFVFAVPIQLTGFKINKMSRLLNAAVGETNKHFEH